MNFCYAYTSRHELARIAGNFSLGIKDGELDLGHITVNGVDEALSADFGNGSEPELYIRTSGEVRLSDFLLWQSRHSLLHNIDIKWPEMNFWYFLGALVRYQFHYPTLKQARDLEL